jgi:NAD(P)-dependent dehydrogenase (short-subunit alcohol dehydrogenase family)
MNRLEGKTAVITGGNSGIGYATAELFLNEGAQVVITGRRVEAVEKAVKTLGNGVTGIVSDAMDMAQVKALPGKVSEFFKKVDIVFANAGVGLFAPFEQTTEGVFDGNLDVNFKGVFFTIQGLLPMIANGGSIILNATILVHAGLHGSSAYSASKGAVLTLGKTLAMELADRNIRVNCISPGPISTPIYSKLGMDDTALQDFATGVLAKIPMKRFGEAHDIASAALFLASNESSFMTGAEILVDGGKSKTF